MQAVKVVVRFADGRILKGYTSNFHPDKPVFHIHPIGSDTAGSDTGEGVKVYVRELKAVFFVKDFAGDARYRDPVDFNSKQHAPGHIIEVEFTDGEVLTGITTSYDLKRQGFFFFAADLEGNNIKVFAVSKSVREVSKASSFTQR
jgi:hypothetical protein